MLQNIRKNIQGWAARIIIGLIILTFALFGVESILAPGGDPSVAEVNGQPISRNDLQIQINMQKRRLMMSMGDNLDPAMLDDQVLAGPALEYMVQKALLLQSADDYSLAISDEKLNEFITGNPAFHIEGRFDPQRYQTLLSDQGFTPAGFREALREDVLMTQLRAGISGAEFATPAELDQLAILREERRDIRYLTVPIERFKDASALPEEEIQNWYEERQEQYQSAETVDLEYIELRAEDFTVEVEESEVRALFESQKDDLVLPEQRAVSHILFEQGEDETEEALRARIAALQAEIATDASNFAELAAKHSQDLGSANFGGELGFTSGDAFPEEIEFAVAALALNTVSQPVNSEAGWHLLLVTDIRTGEAPSFEEMQMELTAELSQERSRRELITTAENLKDLVFNAEDLRAPAAELDLTVASAEGIGRAGGAGIFADQRVLRQAFSPELLGEGFNSDVIELDDGHFVVFRVARHKPAEALPLEVVRDDVVSAILESQARDKAVAYADELLAKLAAGSSVEELALAEGYDWQVELSARRDSLNLPQATREAAFGLLAPTQGSSFDYAQTANGDVEVFEIFRVTAGTPDTLNEQDRQRIGNTLADQSARVLDGAFQRTLAESAEVVRS